MANQHPNRRKEPVPGRAATDHSAVGAYGEGVSSNMSGHGNEQLSGTPGGPGNGGASGSGMRAPRGGRKVGQI